METGSQILYFSLNPVNKYFHSIITNTPLQKQEKDKIPDCIDSVTLLLLIVRLAHRLTVKAITSATWVPYPASTHEMVCLAPGRVVRLSVGTPVSLPTVKPQTRRDLCQREICLVSCCYFNFSCCKIIKVKTFLKIIFCKCYRG